MWPDTHQGAGLLGFVPGPGPRLLPVLGHAGATLELEVLWQLAQHLQRLGEHTLVLDASAQESAHEPGLAQWLGTPAGVWPDGAPAFAVVPAAQGLGDLAAWGRPREALALLAAAVRHFACVLLYAEPAQVAALLADASVSPLVINVPGDAALVRSYAVLKQMAGLAPLRCTVAAVAPRAADLPAAQHALQVLRERGLQWLGAQVRTVAVAIRDEEAFGALALQLMEGACTVQAVPARPAPVSGRAITRYHEPSMV